MPKQNPPSVADYIESLQINGLEGRMLSYPAPANKSRRILVIYGHHGMIERWWPLVENLHAYGAVTLPDLPGFGGMESFYKIGQRPNIDAYADYLASFIKMRYRRGKFTIVAISFGFLVVTRMLQKYPDIAKQVELSVSLAGFVHYDDFSFSRRQRLFYSSLSWLLSCRPLSFVTRHGVFSGPMIHWMYSIAPASKQRVRAMSPEDAKRMIDMEVKLWAVNDMRTHWLTTSQFLRVDNCQFGSVKVPTWHVTNANDFYFDNDVVEQHMQVIFSDYHRVISKSKNHTPSVVADKKEAAVMLPRQIKQILNRPPER